MEGRDEVGKVLCGVTASQALVDLAVAERADTIVVHHGYFWKGEDGRITGIRRARLRALLANDINLLAYHLPLDLHPELGNNAQLAKLMNWSVDGRFGEQDLGWIGALASASRVDVLARSMSARLGREAMLVGGPSHAVRRIAWCTGGAQSLFESAIAAGAEVFVSGEISEQTVHLARESGVAYIAAGHHATERYGIKALSAHLASELQVQSRFVDLDNPV